MKSAFDVRHPFFRPLWRRAALTVFTLVWAFFELSNGATLWAALFGACGAYLFYQFFVIFDRNDYGPLDKDPE
ncbi:hypothetical protein N9C96_01640 [bacterium]|nr:hypothetical protein [bacterium]